MLIWKRLAVLMILLLVVVSTQVLNKSDAGNNTGAAANNSSSEILGQKADTENIKAGSVPVQASSLQSLELAPDIKKIADKGKLMVGVYHQDRPPFFMTGKNGELYGYDIELAKDLAKHLGVDVEFNREAKTFQQLLEFVAEGKVDIVISKFSKTVDRAKYVRFSRPYINLRRALMVNRVEAAKRKIEDYPMDYLREAKVKVGVVLGTSFVEYSKELFKNAVIVQYPQWSQVVDALVKGEIVACLYDENEVIKLVRQKPDIALYSTVYTLKDQNDPIAMAVPWQSGQLLSWIDTYLDNYQISEDVYSLIEKYPDVYKEASAN